jgi:hypothetical protein
MNATERNDALRQIEFSVRESEFCVPFLKDHTAQAAVMSLVLAVRKLLEVVR